LGERSRQRCTGAIDYNPGAALAGVLGGDEFAVVAQRPVCLHSRCYRAGSFHIADARHFTAGVHILSWQICLLKLIMALGIPATAWIENSALIVVPGVLAIGAVFWWHWRDRHA